MQRMTSTFRTTLVVVLACALISGVGPGSAAAQDEYDRYHHDRYVFATTRGLNELEMHPAFKLPAWPVAFAIDLVLLPFAALADAMNP